jgi:hypothetical protein
MPSLVRACRFSRIGIFGRNASGDRVRVNGVVSVTWRARADGVALAAPSGGGRHAERRDDRQSSEPSACRRGIGAGARDERPCRRKPPRRFRREVRGVSYPHGGAEFVDKRTALEPSWYRARLSAFRRHGSHAACSRRWVFVHLPFVPRQLSRCRARARLSRELLEPGGFASSGRSVQRPVAAHALARRGDPAQRTRRNDRLGSPCRRACRMHLVPRSASSWRRHLAAVEQRAQCAVSDVPRLLSRGVSHSASRVLDQALRAGRQRAD